MPSFGDANASGRAVRHVTTTTVNQVTIADFMVIADTDTAGGAVRLALPDATICAGQRFLYQLNGLGYVMGLIPFSTGQLIDGKAFSSSSPRWLVTPYVTFELVSDGAGWLIGTTNLPGSDHMEYAQLTIKSGDLNVVPQTTYTPFQSSFAFAPNSLQKGASFRLTGNLTYTTPTGTAPTNQAQIRLGAVTIISTGNLSNTVGANGQPGYFDVQATVTADGASGTVECGGFLMYGVVGGTPLFALIPSSVSSLDTTIANTLTAGVVANAVNAANTFTLRQFRVSESRPVKASV